MAHLTNFSFEFFYEMFTEDASLLLLCHGTKKSKMTKNSNQGGPALITFCMDHQIVPRHYSHFSLVRTISDREQKEICSISSRSRVLAHRPCPKLEMFCPSVLQLFYGCSKVLMTNHGISFCFCFLFFKPAGDPSSATLVPDLANQV